MYLFDLKPLGMVVLSVGDAVHRFAGGCAGLLSNRGNLRAVDPRRGRSQRIPFGRRYPPEHFDCTCRIRVSLLQSPRFFEDYLRPLWNICVRHRLYDAPALHPQQ